MKWILENILGIYKEQTCKVISKPVSDSKGNWTYNLKLISTQKYFLWIKIKTIKEKL